MRIHVFDTWFGLTEALIWYHSITTIADALAPPDGASVQSVQSVHIGYGAIN